MKRNTLKKWTKKETKYLQNNYSKLSVKEIANNLNRPLLSIYDKARHSKLKRNIFGKNNSSWKGGKSYNYDGYIILNGKYDCPYSKIKGRIQEHIYVWWKNHPDEPILLNEIIHHINRNRQDNRIENLCKMTNREHSTLCKKKKKKEFGGG